MSDVFEKVAVRTTQEKLDMVQRRKRRRIALAKSIMDRDLNAANRWLDNEKKMADYNPKIAKMEHQGKIDVAMNKYKAAEDKINSIANKDRIAFSRKIEKGDSFKTKVGKKIKYAGGIDWGNDGVDLAKDIWKENKGKILAGTGLTLAGAAILAKKYADRKTKEAVKARVQKHYNDKRFNKQDEDNEKKAMVMHRDYRSPAETRIRDIAGIALPFAASIPATVVLTAGSEILKQRKKEKERAQREAERKERNNQYGRRYNGSNYRGGQKHKNFKPNVQSQRRSDNAQNSRAVRV